MLRNAKFASVTCLLLCFCCLWSTLQGQTVTATITVPDGTACQNASSPFVILTGLGGTAPYTFTYTIDGAPHTISTTGADSSVVILAPTSTPGVYVYTVTSVSDGVYATFALTESATITILPLPAPDFTVSSSQCASTSFTYTGTPNIYDYFWSFGDGSTSTAQNPAYGYPGTLTGITSNYTVNLTVRDDTPYHCTNSVTKQVTAYQVPDPRLGPTDIPNVFRKCTDDTNPQEFTFLNLSTTRAINTQYSINWGDGSPAFSASSFDVVNHTYPFGVWTLTFTVSSGSCTRTAAYTVFIGNVPGVTVTKPANTQICAGSTIIFPLSASVDNPVGSTSYTINFGDGTDPIPMLDPLPASISHRYDSISCLSEILGAGGMIYTCAFRFSILAENYCGVASGDVYPIYVSAPPVARIKITSDSICAGSPVCMINDSDGNTEVVTTTGTYAYCRPANIVWEITPSTGYTVDGNMGTAVVPADPNYWIPGDDRICPTFTDPGTYTVTLRIGNKCGIDIRDTVICVGEALTSQFMLDATEGCAPLTIRPVSMTDTFNSCHPPRYIWTSTYAAGNCGTSTSYTFVNGQSSASPTIQLHNPGTYSLRLTVANACGTHTSDPQDITVKDKPQLSAISPETTCETPSGTTVTPSVSVDSCHGGTVSYTWSFPDGVPVTDNGVATSGHVSSSVVYATPGVKTIHLQAVNACGISTASGELTIYTAPVMTPVGNKQYCHGAAVPAISFSATPEAIYSWTNSNPSIGLAAAGNGSIPPFTAVNNGMAPDTATIIVSPSTGGCPGTSETFTITIYPSPGVLFSLSNQTICSGDTILPVALRSAADSVLFHWSAVPAGGITGQLVSGTDTIPAHPLTNTTNAPITVRYRAYAELAYAPFCTGALTDYIITVNPCPAIDTQRLVVCSGEAFSYVPSGSGAIIPDGTVYSWTAPATDAGISGGAAGTDVPTISGTLVNASDTIRSATYTVTPKAGVCTGEPFILIVTVYLKPVIDNRTDTICSGAAFSIVPVHSGATIVPDGTTYRWPTPVCNPPGAVTGFSGATGQASIGQTLTNGMTGAATVTYTVTPVSGTSPACEGLPFTVTIVVKPSPSGQITGSTEVCILSPEPALTFTGSNGVAPYIFFYTVDGGSEQSIVSSGATATVLAPTTATGSYVYSLTRITDASVNTCSGGLLSEATVTVTLPPVITQPVDTQIICVGGSPTPLSVAYSYGAGTPVYQWYRNTTPTTVGGTPIAGATTDTYTPPPSDFSAAGTYYYYVTIEFLYSGCASQDAVIAAIHVYDPPVIVAQPPDSLTICLNTPVTLEVTVSGGVGDYQYTWFQNYIYISDSSTCRLTGDENEAGTYTCIITQLYSGCTVTTTATVVDIIPGPSIAVQPQPFDVCRRSDAPTLTVESQNGTGAPVYQWYQSATDQYGDGEAIAGAIAASYIPPTGMIDTVWYYCIISFAGGLCTNLTSDIVPIRVRPVPIIADKTDSINTGTMFFILPVTDATDTVPSGTTYTWEVLSVVPPGGVTGATDEQLPQTAISQYLAGAVETVVVTYRVTPVTAGCVGQPFTVEITVFPPFNPEVTITNIPCHYSTGGGRIEMSITGGVPPYTVAWTGPNGFVSDTTALDNLEAGVYYLLLTDDRGGTYSGSYTIARPEALALTTVDVQHVTCFGAMNGAITMNMSGGITPYAYTWTRNGALFADSLNLSGLGPGSYALSVTDYNACTPVTASVVITEPELLTVSLITQTDLSCFESGDGSIEIRVDGGIQIPLPSGDSGYRYTWTGPDGFTGSEQNGYNLPAGEYTVTVEDAFCAATATATLTQPVEIVLDAVATPISCYGADDATITVSVVSGGVAPFQATWNTYLTGFYKDNMPPGDYVITVTDATGCASSIGVHIEQPPLFVINPTVRHVSCYGEGDGSIRLYFEGGVAPVSFAWEDDPAAGSDRTHLSAGTYTVHISDAQPCRFDRTFIVIEPSTLTVAAAITHVMDCYDINGGAIQLNVSGGTPPYRYLWSTGDTTGHLTAIPANDYLIDITDHNGCTATQIYTVQRPLPVDVQVESAPSFDCTTNRNIRVTTAIVTGGVPPYTYQWSRGTPVGANGESMATDEEGMAFVTVIDQRGCRAETSFDVSVTQGVFGIEPEMKDCTQHVYTFDASVYDAQPGDTYLWDFGDGSTATGRLQTHRFEQPGIYTVSLTVTNRICTYVLAQQLGVEGPPDLLIYPVDPKFCPGDSIVLTVTGAETYLWSDGSEGNTLAVYEEGTYIVQGVSPAGCRNERSVSVALYPFENYTITTDKQAVTNAEPTVLVWTQETPATLYSWDFGDGEEGRGNPAQHTYAVTGDGYFIIKLSAINPYGCLETDEVLIHADNALHPNTFSPNGDGINDLFMQGWQLEIYNRNGVLFYRGSEGWDGTYRNTPVSNDTYFYCIFDKGATGAIKNCGYVTVIR
ncbi:MAG: PKD domain-containing protein [Prevotellaceae bacterium]|nr:PKD domain-containing protein [Prevotellaceae bacterium]